MTFDMHSHPSEDMLENYSLGHLSENVLDRIEEHLLVCEQCQEQVVQIDSFVGELRVACREQRWKQQPSRAGLLGRLLTIPRPLFAGACAALLLAVALPVTKYRSSTLAPSAVAWDSTVRGTDSPVESRAGRPLHLQIGIAELSPAGSYRVEVVDAGGSLLWSGTPRREKSALVADVASPFRAGLYWVRLYGTGRDALREFGLLLK